MVVTGGRTGRRHGDGRRRQRPPGQFVPEASFLNCSTMRLWEIRMWREVRVSFVKLSLFAFYPSFIDRTVYIIRWQAHHHRQLVFFIRVQMISLLTTKVK